LGDDFGTTEDPQQSIEHFVDRAIADRFLRDLHLFLEGSQKALPLQTRN
jgi:hypothetical protein